MKITILVMTIMIMIIIMITIVIAIKKIEKTTNMNTNKFHLFQTQ